MTKPKHIGRYEIIEETGRGGFAVVYKARDSELDRVIALKVLHPYWAEDPSFAARFRHEARAAAKLHHPNIVIIYDAGEAEGQLYIAMEHLSGCTLQEWLEDKGTLSLELALRILEQVAGALDYAHEQGVVHRDIKPSNVIVEETKRGVRATLTDFGLVKAMEGSVALTSQGTLLGSPEYMAPEQADPERATEVGPATDRYALGIVAYRMLAGRVPFPGNAPATLNAHEHKPVPPPRSLRPDLSEPVEVALLKMLAKAPADRYPNTGDFVADLRKTLLTDSQIHEREAQLASFYERLQSAAEEEDWAEVLALGGQIQALASSYRDVPQLMAQVREHLSQPRRKLALPLTWGVGTAGLLILVMLLCIGIILGSQLWDVIFPLAEALVEQLTGGFTEVPTEVSTQVPIETPTGVSTQVPIEPPTEMPTQALTESPTKAPTEVLETPTKELTVGPITLPTQSTAGGPPLNASLGYTWTRPADGMVMVYVPGGTFQMGSDKGTPGINDDEWPKHSITLDGFWIDRTEVTNAQYALCVANNDWSNKCRRSSYANDPIYNGDDYPVVGVSWYDARTYCTWVGGRLPIEAEWEYAARGPDGHVYPWGDTFDGMRLNFCDRRCPFWEWDNEEYDDGYAKTAPVGKFPSGASWIGALDMAGNVWEWVEDTYAAYPGSSYYNPDFKQPFRVLRGGSWFHSARDVRTAYRYYNPPSNNFDAAGFRCVVVSKE